MCLELWTTHALPKHWMPMRIMRVRQPLLRAYQLFLNIFSLYSAMFVTVHTGKLEVHVVTYVEIVCTLERSKIALLTTKYQQFQLQYTGS